MTDKVVLLGCLAVLLPLGCRDNPVVLSEMTIRIEAQDFEPQGYQGLTVEVGTRLGFRRFTADRFFVTSVPLPSTEPFDVPNEGEAVIRLEFSESGGLIASGNILISLRPNTEWGIRIFRRPSDPIEDCFFCDGSERIEIVPEHQRVPGEAIWVSWGGNRRGTQS